MKNLFFLIALATTFTFFSCSSDDNAEPTAFMTAQVDGGDFEAVTITAVADSSLGELIAFTSGTDTNSNFAIGLNIPASVDLNASQTIDASDFGITFSDGDDNNAFFTVGQITITKFDESSKTVEGSFDFVATNDSDDTDIHTVTDGSFRIIYIN